MLAGRASAGVASGPRAGDGTGSGGAKSASAIGMITDGAADGIADGWFAVGDVGISIDCERPTPAGCATSAACRSVGSGIENFAPHCGQTPRFPARCSLTLSL